MSPARLRSSRTVAAACPQPGVQGFQFVQRRGLGFAAAAGAGFGQGGLKGTVQAQQGTQGTGGFFVQPRGQGGLAQFVGVLSRSSSSSRGRAAASTARASSSPVR